MPNSFSPNLCKQPSRCSKNQAEGELWDVGYTYLKTCLQQGSVFTWAANYSTSHMGSAHGTQNVCFYYFHRRRIATADLKASSHLGKSQPSASSFGVWALSFWLWSSSGWVIPLAVKDESRTYGLVAFLSYWWNVIWQKVRVSGFCWKSKKYVFDKGGCGKKQDCHKLQTDYIPKELLALFVWDCW